MSNFLAISAVTLILKNILRKKINEDVDPEVIIYLKNIHKIPTDPPDNGLNIFLYQVSPNPGYSNLDLPMRDQRGNLLSDPTIGLDIHYLLTPYAVNNDEIITQQILASALNALNEIPVLTDHIIDRAVSLMIENSETASPILDSAIRDQLERIKIIHKPLSLEETSKIFSSQLQTNYRLSLAYLATPILLNGLRKPSRALPVKTRNIYTSIYSRPSIDRIEPNQFEWSSSNPARELVVMGSNFPSANCQVLIDDEPLPTSNIIEMRNERILIDLSTVNLSPGLKRLNVASQITRTSEDGVVVPAAEEQSNLILGPTSNTVMLEVSPRLVSNFPIQVTRGTETELEFEPPINKDQKIQIIVGSKSLEIAFSYDEEYPLSKIKLTKEHTCLFQRGTHLFRLRIDGAETILQTDNDSSSPNYGTYNGPTIEVLPSDDLCN